METFDVVVLGTGAAALTAAISAADEGASVGLFEKAYEVGGTTAWSGGMVWIPMNPHMAELGIDDTREEVMTYLGSLSNGLIDEQLAGAMVDAGPEVVSYLEANTPVRFQIIKDFPDYHPEHPGAKAGGGRSLECPLFAFDELGPWQHRVTVGPQLSGNITMGETSLGRGAPTGSRRPSWSDAGSTTNAARVRVSSAHSCAAAWTAASSLAPGCAPSSYSVTATRSPASGSRRPTARSRSAPRGAW